MKPVLWAVLALALVAAALGGLWWAADRAWLSPPPPGFWRLVVRVDKDYDERLATLLMLDLTMFSDRGSRGEVESSKRPRHMRVWHDFPRERGDDAAAILKDARMMVFQTMHMMAIRWRVALIDEEGNTLIAGAAEPAGP